MEVSHPRADDDDVGPPPSFVDVNGERVPVADDGTFEIDDEYWLDDFAAAHDCSAEDLVVDEDADQPAGDEPETCDVVKSDGEVCGRSLPCQYHTEDDEGGD